MEVNIGMQCQPVIVSLVGGVVVQDDVDLLTEGHLGDDIIEKCLEVWTLLDCGDLGVDRAGGYVRRRKQINLSSQLDGIWLYDVVPLTVKGVAHNVDARHLLIADLAPSRILATIQTTLDFQTFGGCRPGDQVDNGFVINQRLAAPIRCDKREQAMLDLVPFAGARWKMTDGDGQACLICELLQLQLPQPQA